MFLLVLSTLIKIGMSERIVHKRVNPVVVHYFIIGVTYMRLLHLIKQSTYPIIRVIPIPLSLTDIRIHSTIKCMIPLPLSCSLLSIVSKESQLRLIGRLPDSCCLHFI